MKTKRLKIIFLLLLLTQLTIYAQMPSIREKKTTLIPTKNVTDDTSVLIKIDTEKYQTIYQNHEKELIEKKTKEGKENALIDQELNLLKVYKEKKTLSDKPNVYSFTKEEIKDSFVQKIIKGGEEIKFLKSNILYDYHKRQIKNYKNQIKEKYAESKDPKIQDNLERISQISNDLDKLFEDLKNEELRLENVDNPKFNFWFPSTYSNNPYKKEAFFETLYGKSPDNDFYFVNNAALQLNSAGSTIQSEITAAYLKPLRVSLGTLVSNSSTEEADEADNQKEADDTEAFQRLLSGGGNIYMNIELPALYYGNDFFKIYGSLYTKGAMEISEFSNDVDTSTGNGSVGGSLYMSVATDKKEFVFYTASNWGIYAGSDAFLDRLKVQKNYFGFGQVTFGVTILDRLRLSLMTNTFGVRELQSGRVVFGVQVLSGLFK